MSQRTFELTLRATVSDDTRWPDGSHGFLDSLAAIDQQPEFWQSGYPQGAASVVAEMITTHNTGMTLTLVGANEVPQGVDI